MGTRTFEKRGHWFSPFLLRIISPTGDGPRLASLLKCLLLLTNTPKLQALFSSRSEMGSPEGSPRRGGEADGRNKKMTGAWPAGQDRGTGRRQRSFRPQIRCVAA